jgi:hypothetical protein
MPVVADALNRLLSEEVDFKSGLTENLFTRIGGDINFLANRNAYIFQWELNGRIASFSTGTFGLNIDGLKPVPYDLEIESIFYSIGVVDGAGTTNVEFDIHKYTGGDTDAGTIFTTRPKIDDTAASDTYTMYRVSDANTLANPTGHTLAVLDGGVTLNEGDALGLQIDNQDTGYNSFSLILSCRPR